MPTSSVMELIIIHAYTMITATPTTVIRVQLENVYQILLWISTQLNKGIASMIIWVRKKEHNSKKHGERENMSVRTVAFNIFIHECMYRQQLLLLSITFTTTLSIENHSLTWFNFAMFWSKIYNTIICLCFDKEEFFEKYKIVRVLADCKIYRFFSIFQIPWSPAQVFLSVNFMFHMALHLMDICSKISSHKVSNVHKHY